MQTGTQIQDEQLLRIEKKRIFFKKTLSIYVLSMMFLIGVWYFATGFNSYFWPKWPMMGWGLGIAINYLNAYHTNKPF